MTTARKLVTSNWQEQGGRGAGETKRREEGGGGDEGGGEGRGCEAAHLEDGGGGTAEEVHSRAEGHNQNLRG